MARVPIGLQAGCVPPVSGYTRETPDCAAPRLENLSSEKCGEALYQEVGFLMVPPTPSGTPDGNCAFGSRFSGNSLDV